MNETNQILFNPFPGLRPFEPEENHLFFGRDGQNDELLKRLRRTRFLAVVGTSGSGKSSLVRAGLLPDLYGGMMAKAGSRWRIALFRPGSDPIGNMASAMSDPDVLGKHDANSEQNRVLIETSLRRGDVGLLEAVQEARIPARENVLLVVDQFEELFRFKLTSSLAGSENEAAAFVKLLLTGAASTSANIFVVMTMRSDYLGDCAQFRDLPEAINDGQYLIPRMTRDQRRQAITGPVAVGGATITPRLVNRLLNDVGDNPDQLPILQHALMRTWDYWAEDHRDGEPIDLPHYLAIGGMAAALSKHADEAYADLPDEMSRQIAEKMFKALTERGEDNRETRRPTKVGDICDLSDAELSQVAKVIDTFRQPGRTFLMPPAAISLAAKTLIDISHESLIRNWERLKQWVDEEAKSAQVYRRLAETALLHKEGRAGLWRDPDLQIALDWQEQNAPNEVWAQRYYPQFGEAIQFLENSKQAREQEIAEKEAARKREIEQAQALADEQRKRADAEREKAEEQKKAASRLRRRAVALFVVALVAAGLAAIAVIFYGVAETQKQEAVAARAKADSLRQVAEVAFEQEKIARTNADSARRVAVAQKVIADSLRQEAEQLKVLAEERALLAELAKDEALRQKDRADSLRIVAFNNWQIAEKNRMEADTLRRITTALLLAVQSSLVPNDTLALLAARGAYFLNRNNRGDLNNDIYEALRHALMRPSFEPAGGPNVSARHLDWGEAVAFSPDGDWVASGGADSLVVLWNLGQNNRGTISLTGHNASVNSVDFRNDGKLLVSGSDDHTVRLWNVENKASLIRTLDNLPDRVWSVAFDPGGGLMAAGSADGSIVIWNVENGEERQTLSGHQGSVRSIAFSPDGQTLASASTDGTIRLWKVGSDRNLVLNQPSRARSVAFNQDGSLLASGGDDNLIRVWNLEQPGSDPRIVRGHDGPVNAVAFSPNLRLLASASGDQTVKIWNLDKLLKQPPITLQHDQWVWSVAFSPDGQRLATASSDKSIRVWISNTDTLVDISLQQIDRTMSEAEWHQIVGDEIPFEPNELTSRKQ